MSSNILDVNHFVANLELCCIESLKLFLKNDN